MAGSDENTRRIDSGRNPSESAKPLSENASGKAKKKSLKEQDADWGFEARKSGMATEAKMGMAIVVILVCAFGFLVYHKFDLKQRALLQANIEGTGEQPPTEPLEQQQSFSEFYPDDQAKGQPTAITDATASEASFDNTMQSLTDSALAEATMNQPAFAEGRQQQPAFDLMEPPAATTANVDATPGVEPAGTEDAFAGLTEPLPMQEERFTGSSVDDPQTAVDPFAAVAAAPAEPAPPAALFPTEELPSVEVPSFETPPENLAVAESHPLVPVPELEAPTELPVKEPESFSQFPETSTVAADDFGGTPLPPASELGLATENLDPQLAASLPVTGSQQNTGGNASELTDLFGRELPPADTPLAKADEGRLLPSDAPATREPAFVDSPPADDSTFPSLDAPGETEQPKPGRDTSTMIAMLEPSPGVQLFPATDPNDFPPLDTPSSAARSSSEAGQRDSNPSESPAEIDSNFSQRQPPSQSPIQNTFELPVDDFSASTHTNTHSPVTEPRSSLDLRLPTPPAETNLQPQDGVAHILKAPGIQQAGFTDDYDVCEVKPNDTYWKISKRVYGTPRYFASLALFNQKRISDPRKLRPGMKVLLPSPEHLEQKYPELFKNSRRKPSQPSGYFLQPDGSPAYRIGERETLSEISRRHLGRASRWMQIYRLNRSILKDPNKLKPGTVIALPDDATDVHLAP